MKSPSTSLGESLKRQRAPGRTPITVPQPERQKRGVANVAPGEGSVISGPGAAARHHERSSAHYADVVGRRFGGG